MTESISSWIYQINEKKGEIAMNKQTMDVYFKTYYQKGKEYEPNYLFGLYFKAVQEYCQHFSAVCMYAEETSAGVIPDEKSNINDEMDAMATAAMHLERQKNAFLKMANIEGCAVTDLYNFDASAYCETGNAYVKNGLLVGAENLSMAKIKDQVQHVRPSGLTKFEQAEYLLMLCPQKEVG